jgi:hypothetical protein
MAPTDPLHVGTVDRDAVRPLHSAGQTDLHIAAQHRAHGELGGLRAPRAPVGMPLRGRGPVLESAAAGRGVAPQFPGDRRRRPTELARDLPHPGATGAQDRDLLPLGKRQVAPGRRSESDRRHPATLPKPPDANRGRRARLRRRILARQPSSDRRPEPLTMLEPAHRRTPRRPHRRPPSPIRTPPPRCAHRNSLSLERCDDRLNPPCTPPCPARSSRFLTAGSLWRR